MTYAVPEVEPKEEDDRRRRRLTINRKQNEKLKENERELSLTKPKIYTMKDRPEGIPMEFVKPLKKGGGNA